MKSKKNPAFRDAFQSRAHEVMEAASAAIGEKVPDATIAQLMAGLGTLAFALLAKSIEDRETYDKAVDSTLASWQHTADSVHRHLNKP